MRRFWFMVEAVIAGVIIVTFVAFLLNNSISGETQDVTTEAYRILEGLDKQGLLDQDAHNLNHTNINNRVKIAAYSHSVQICSLGRCSDTRPSADDIWVATYIVSGVGQYNPKEVKLYLYK